MKKFLLGLLIFALTLSLFHNYLNSGFPYTNDGENHLARFANYKIALKEGQFPPRFAPNLMNHYGYPVFNFNYPLANILSVPFSFIKVNPETTYKVISILAFILGTIGVYKLLRTQHRSLFVIAIGIALFGIQPYLANVILYRGSIGELLAYCCLPWLFWSLHFIKEYQKLSILTVLVWSLFLLSHNVTVVIAMPVLILYTLVNSDKLKAKRFLLLSALNALISLALTLWFWLPALLEANQTVVKEAGIANNFLNHFPTLNQLLFGQIQFGFSYPGPIDSLSFQLGLASVFIIFVSCIALIKSLFSKNKSTGNFLFLISSVFLLIILQLNISAPFWQAFPQLEIIQFPWRLSILFSALIPLLWAESVAFYTRNLKKLLLTLCFISVYLLAQLRPVDFFHRNQIDYDLFSQSTSTQNENRTKEFTYLEIGDWQPKPKIDGIGEATVINWTGTHRAYTVNLQAPSRITEPTMNFSGWRTRIKDISGNVTGVEYLNDNEAQGRIAFNLPQGEYEVETRFTQQTPARIIGNAVSLITVILLGIWWVKTQLSNRYVKIK